MTRRLYYEDVYQKTFQGTVVACQEGKQGYEVILDQSVFYPEGGGQPGDCGTLLIEGTKESVEVFDTHEKNEEILHYTKTAIPIGTVVTGTINWERRFDHMQNHSGEHIVSGLICSRFGCNNVGFHMGKDMTTIDFDGEFSQEEMQEIELAANERIWRNELTQIQSYTEEEVKSVEYRSKKELHGMVRIVTFPDADICACCGTHVTRTGEIGLIKLLSIQKFRSGVRIEMVCGRKAFAYIHKMSLHNSRISVALSAKPLETADAVDRMKESLAKSQYRVVELENASIEATAQKHAGTDGAILFEDGLTADGVRKLAARLIEVNSGRCIVFSGEDGQGYKYACGQEGGDLREFVKAMNKELNGRGGGKPFFAQGSVQATKEDIVSFLARS